MDEELFQRVDKGHAHLACRHVELGHDGLAEGLGSDGGTVGEVDHGALRLVVVRGRERHGALSSGTWDVRDYPAGCCRLRIWPVLSWPGRPDRADPSRSGQGRHPASTCRRAGFFHPARSPTGAPDAGRRAFPAAKSSAASAWVAAASAPCVPAAGTKVGVATCVVVISTISLFSLGAI